MTQLAKQERSLPVTRAPIARRTLFYCGFYSLARNFPGARGTIVPSVVLVISIATFIVIKDRFLIPSLPPPRQRRPSPVTLPSVSYGFFLLSTVLSVGVAGRATRILGRRDARGKGQMRLDSAYQLTD